MCFYLYSEGPRDKSETQYGAFFVPEKLTQIEVRANEERVLKPRACRFGILNASRSIRGGFSARCEENAFL
jgi:hypothetical protein